MKGRLIGAASHEIGHIFVGPGHPDNYPEFGASNIVGPAPLKGTDTLKRLMHSGVGEKGLPMLRNLEDNGRQLVKGEWDAAESWMHIQVSEGRISE